MFLSVTFNCLIMNKNIFFIDVFFRFLLASFLILLHEEINANFHNALFV